MVERRFCTPEASGSIPLGSTKSDFEVKSTSEIISFVLNNKDISAVPKVVFLSYVIPTGKMSCWNFFLYSGEKAIHNASSDVMRLLCVVYVCFKVVAVYISLALVDTVNRNLVLNLLNTLVNSLPKCNCLLF